MGVPLQLWAGPECTVNRVGDRYSDQLARSGFAQRLEDIDRLAQLGIRALRFPLLWERTQALADAEPDWSWADARIGRLRRHGVAVIAGLLHHGSGPRGTHLLDPEFPAKLARYARAAARRYPDVQAWTPVNEPLTTARFSALYGLWFPHQRDDRSFVRALLHQVQGTVQAMAAIREVTPGARLVQTEDLGLATAATASMQEQADFENLRRWLSLDLLAGRVGRTHPLWAWLLQHGAREDELRVLMDAPCTPDLVGVNSYVTSERFLDDRLWLYPPALQGGNGRQRYVDIETARVQGAQIGGFGARLREAWERYGLPLAITEVHLGCTREEQMRWLLQAWRTSQALREEGLDLRAVTVWAAFGTYDWDSLVTREDGHYEPGLWDASSDPPRPTALAQLAAQLGREGRPSLKDHPVLTGPGWWQRDLRLAYPCHGDIQGQPVCGQPLLIAGATGTLGQAYARLCEARGLPYHLLSRQEMDIADPASVDAALARWQPWAVVNAAGFVRVDAAEQEPRHWRENVVGAQVLAAACDRAGVRLLAFSSDLVFDGEATRPYLESDLPRPLNAYGRSKLEAERHLLALAPRALVVRTAAFFGPWDRHNFLTLALDALRRGECVMAPHDQWVSPTYVPDLVHATLDLLVDGERGLWHLANRGAVSWWQWARLAAQAAGLDPGRVQASDVTACTVRAVRPRFSALASERGQLMPPLEDSLRRYLREHQPAPQPPARSVPADTPQALPQEASAGTSTLA
jgi:dTDP-4-dehydrorhamnose reductase